MISLCALLIGFALDLLFGDPPRCPHIVVGMGKMISLVEQGLRGIFPPTARGELHGGTIMAVLLPLFWGGLAWALLFCCELVHPLARLPLESFVCWQCLSLRSLREAALKVSAALKRDDLPEARLALSQIVGRDTSMLDETGVVRAAVESVAENTGDGVIAPLLFLLVGGAPFGVFYKAINTMDSMVGYRNSRYLHFGRAAAILDDMVNFIPSRMAGLLAVPVASLFKLNGRNAWRVFCRDRFNHSSPNSGQTEAAFAGALRIQLGGDAVYFGETVSGPTLGDDDRLPEADDIELANRLLHGVSFVCLLLGLVIKGVIVCR